METQEFAFRLMLNDIGHSLTDRDFHGLKYLCRAFIPRGRLEDIEDPRDLWDALEQREKLGMNNINFLKALLTHGTEGRLDLVSILLNYESSVLGNIDVHNGPAVASPPVKGFELSNPVRSQPQCTELRREVEFIVKNIGRDWRQFVRALGVCEADIECVSEQYPRDLREKIRQTLLLWQSQNPGTATKQALVHALKLCERNDMVHQMMRGQY